MAEKWTADSEEVLVTLTKEGRTAEQIAGVLGRSLRSVTGHLWAMRKRGVEIPAAAEVKATPVDEDPKLIAYWQAETRRLQRALEKAENANLGTQILIDEIKSIAPISYTPPPALVKPPSPHKSSPQSAVLLFSDTHIGKVVQPEQTLGFGAYNFGIFRRMMKKVESSILSIIHDHTTTEVSEIVVAMIGDMIDGKLIHSVEAGQVNTVFEQFYCAGHVIAQALNNLSAVAPLRIYTAVGNHPRWDSQRKMPTNNRFSNLDQFLYAYIQALLQGNPRIQFNLDKQPFAVFDVQGHRIFAGHGDNLRGGDKILGIPAHSIGRCVANTSQRFIASANQPPNLYCFGHLHRGIQIPHALGDVLINGAFVVEDGFGINEAFVPTKPMQRFFFIHPKGPAAEYRLRLHDYNRDGEDPYNVPPGFTCL